MTIVQVACNGQVSTAHVHWAGFDLEARAAHENMLHLELLGPARNYIDGGSKGTERGQQAMRSGQSQRLPLRTHGQDTLVWPPVQGGRATRPGCNS